MYKKLLIVFVVFGNLYWSKCDVQIGPDPWDYVSHVNSADNEEDIPSDLRTVTKRIEPKTTGTSEWFFKRVLAIVLKGGHVKKNEDGTIDVLLHMKYNQERWTTLEHYISSDGAFSEDMFRRSVGYVEEAIINKPTITKKITIVWSEYIQFYLVEYKIHLTWATSILAGFLAVFWLWRHVSHKHVIILVIIGLYLYEVFISYKEAERQELERFVTAVNTCKWYFWTSSCDVPPPDPIIFLKYMNPLKIGIRMFTTLLSEPMITLSETIKTIIHGVTDGLWFPFDKIMYGFLIVAFNGLLIFLLVMILFNYVLNIPFNLSFLGIFNIGLKQRNRNIHNFGETSQAKIDNADRISGENLTKLFDVYNRALNIQTAHLTLTASRQQTNLQLTYKSNLKKSASTGRLASICNNNNEVDSITRDSSRNFKHKGGGDAR